MSKKNDVFGILPERSEHRFSSLLLVKYSFFEMAVTEIWKPGSETHFPLRRRDKSVSGTDFLLPALPE